MLLGYERIIIKKLGDKSNSEAATFLFFGVASLFFLPFLFIVPPPPDYGFLVYVILSSAIYSVAFVLYVKSLSMGEASLVSPLYNFNIFFLLILSVIFLSETLSLFKIFGLCLLFYGASFLNKQRNILLSFKSLFKDRACVLMILCSLFMAIGRVIDAFVIQTISPLAYAFSIYVGISLFLFIYLIYIKRVKESVRLLKTKPKISITAGAVNAYSYLLLLIALTAIEVSIAEPFSMLGMIVTVVLAYFIFKESIKNRLIGVFIMIFGAFLLYL